jgi:hypothetical protein
MWRPTLSLDGKVVLKDGIWLVPEADVIHKDAQMARAG